MLSQAHVAVVVPARNEARRLPELLRALAGQTGSPAFTLYLFFDGCTDDSPAIASAMAPGLPYRLVTGGTATTLLPNAGRARAAAFELALGDPPGSAIMSTDADSAPAPDWIAANLAALERADLVAGRILLRGQASPLQDRLIRYYDRLHELRRTLDPVEWEDDETHHWTSAASLAMRPDTYREIGGFLPLAGGEDADFADRAWRAGFRVRRDSRAQVWTSTRRSGRADCGLAATLARLDGAHSDPRVSHPADETWRFRHHASARRCFAQGDIAALATPLCLTIADLERVAAEVPNADSFAARVVGAPAGGMRDVPLAQAEALLEALRVDTYQGAA